MVRNMKINACPKCGSKNIQMGTMDAGVIYGVTSWKSVCKECGYQGEPLLFDSEDAYQKFLHGLSAKEALPDIAAEQKDAVVAEEDDTLELSAKDKDVVEMLHELQEEPERKKTKFPENKSWWPEIGLSMMLSAVWILLSASTLFSTLGLVSFLYGLLLFVISTLGVLCALVVIEYIFLSLK